MKKIASSVTRGCDYQTAKHDPLKQTDFDPKGHYKTCLADIVYTRCFLTLMTPSDKLEQRKPDAAAALLARMPG